MMWQDTAFMLTDIIKRIAANTPLLNIGVVGDVILDENVFGTCSRISPEAAIPVFEYSHRTYSPGGAANVAADVMALGARCTLVGLVGYDDNGRILSSELSRVYADLSRRVLVQDERPTTIKTRFWNKTHSANQIGLRIDYERRDPCTGRAKKELLEGVESLKECDLLIISDYGKGAVSRELVETAIMTGKPVIAAPRPSSSTWLQGVHTILPNVAEACEIAKTQGYSGTDIHELARTLQKYYGLAEIVITRGKEGMYALDVHNNVYEAATQARQVYDVTGAGDVALAAFAIATASHCTLPEAMEFANASGGLKVGKVGVATVTLDELRKL
jgi:rfaE bifunctional protein kinase chain/domain